MKDVLPIRKVSVVKDTKMRDLFEQVAPSYDSVTAVISLGMDRRWRRKAVGYLVEKMRGQDGEQSSGPGGGHGYGGGSRQRSYAILDACCGTGELTFMLAGVFPEAVLTGIDFSDAMIVRAKRKMLRTMGVKPERITFLEADMNCLPFADSRFDIVTVAFGLRNSVSHRQSLAELRRVLKPGGVLSVLDCVTPRNTFANKICRCYFHNWVPFVGGLARRRRQYAHLPASIEQFGDPDDITKLLRNNGFTGVIVQPIFRDIVCHFIAF